MSATYQWGGLARLDIVSAPYGTGLAFFGPPALSVHPMPLLQPDEQVQSSASELLESPSSSSAASPSASDNDHTAQNATTQHTGSDRHSAQLPSPSTPKTSTYSLTLVDTVSTEASQQHRSTPQLTEEWQQHIARLNAPPSAVDTPSSQPLAAAQSKGGSQMQAAEATQPQASSLQQPSSGHGGLATSQGTPRMQSDDVPSQKADTDVAGVEQGVKVNGEAQAMPSQLQQQHRLESGLSDLRGNGSADMQWQQQPRLSEVQPKEEHQQALAGMQEDEQLFAEESVRARGGLHMTEKVVQRT